MIPFHITNFFGNQVKLTGVAIPKENGLEFCIHEGDAPTNPLDAETKTIKIPWSNLKEVSIKTGLIGDKLTVRTFQPIERLPQSSATEAVFSLHKRDRKQHKPFLEEIERCRTGTANKDNVEKMIDDVRDFLTDI